VGFEPTSKVTPTSGFQDHHCFGRRTISEQEERKSTDRSDRAHPAYIPCRVEAIRSVSAAWCLSVPAASGVGECLVGEVVYYLCRSPHQGGARGSSGDEPHFSVFFLGGLDAFD
jgi:hypothetical protein